MKNNSKIALKSLAAAAAIGVVTTNPFTTFTVEAASPLFELVDETDEWNKEGETEYENGEPDYEKFNWKAYENGFLEIITGDNIWNYDLESYRYSISPNARTLTLDEYEFSNGLCTLTRVK